MKCLIKRLSAQLVVARQDGMPKEISADSGKSIFSMHVLLNFRTLFEKSLIPVKNCIMLM